MHVFLHTFLLHISPSTFNQISFRFYLIIFFLLNFKRIYVYKSIVFVIFFFLKQQHHICNNVNSKTKKKLNGQNSSRFSERYLW